MPNMMDLAWLISFILFFLLILSLFFLFQLKKEQRKQKKLFKALEINEELWKEKFQETKEENIALVATQKMMKKEIETIHQRQIYLEEELVLKQNSNQTLSLENQKLVSEKQYLTDKYEADKIQLQALEKKFQESFENLSQNILEKKSEKYLKQNEYQISEILKPLKTKILDFENRLQEQYRYQTERNASLDQQLKQLHELNQNITQETKNLTQALKGESKTQGIWGEMLLESILEKSGLRKGLEFTVQESFSVNHERLIPDVVLHLPQNKKIIVDAKVSLSAYEKLVDPQTQDTSFYLQKHLQSVKNHVNLLSSKNYHQIPQLRAQNYVLMFVPLDAALISAQNADANLFSFAYDKKIILVSPSSFHSVLASISSLWQNEKQNQNAAKIAKEAGRLHDKFIALTETMQKLGSQMYSAQNTYDGAMKKLTGRQNLIKNIHRLEQLGAKTSKKISYYEEE